MAMGTWTGQPSCWLAHGPTRTCNKCFPGAKSNVPLEFLAFLTYVCSLLSYQCQQGNLDIFGLDAIVKDKVKYLPGICWTRRSVESMTFLFLSCIFFRERHYPARICWTWSVDASDKSQNRSLIWIILPNSASDLEEFLPFRCRWLLVFRNRSQSWKLRCKLRCRASWCAALTCKNLCSRYIRW